MPQFQTILVPTDFSETADRALQIAKLLAREQHAKLVLMTSPPPQPQPPESAGFPPQLGDPRLIEESRRLLTDLANSITDIPVETRLIVGAPGPCIVTAANECLAQLIVMGTHGHTGLARLLLGSVAEYVLRHAPCPVLTVRPEATKLK